TEKAIKRLLRKSDAISYLQKNKNIEGGNLKKVIIEIETGRPQSVETYLKEVLSTLSKNPFFLIKKYNVKIIEE
ncbi:MAG: hypothetical protein QXX56_01165, partial [Candidatus Bathyarchaeia archaeon]